ncbi:MAG TPA: gamma-glutamyl-gamma-aminobutyrate hydrolase family protein [Jatrophihabitans sp.]|jgi:putative glutamine amidotransferase
MSDRVASPRIGLTTYREPASWGVWSEPADLLPASYAAGVRAAGGVAVLLPPGEPATAADALDAVHGLLLAGGPDVDPGEYGADRDAATGPARRDRDDWELALVRAALARQLPVFAVCRGMQVLNVALGGNLRQHLPDDVGTELHCPTVGVHGRHDVTVAAGSALHAVVGDTAEVATYHHQGVDRIGAGLVATAWAADGVVEAVERPGDTWVLGVQWHPEAFAGEPFFAAFVGACVEWSERSAQQTAAAHP